MKDCSPFLEKIEQDLWALTISFLQLFRKLVLLIQLFQKAWFIVGGVYWKYWSIFLYSQLGTTALMVASYYGHIDCVRELVLQGADINLQREVGEVLRWNRDWLSDYWFTASNKNMLSAAFCQLQLLCSVWTGSVLLRTSRNLMSGTCNRKWDAIFINNSLNICSMWGWCGTVISQV